MDILGLFILFLTSPYGLVFPEIFILIYCFGENPCGPLISPSGHDVQACSDLELFTFERFSAIPC
jgi:hypothetical protein